MCGAGREALDRSSHGSAALTSPHGPCHPCPQAEAPPAAGGPASAALVVQCKASLAVSLALLVKEFAKAAYSVNSERIEAFATGGWVVGWYGGWMRVDAGALGSAGMLLESQCSAGPPGRVLVCRPPLHSAPPTPLFFANAQRARSGGRRRRWRWRRWRGCPRTWTSWTSPRPGTRSACARSTRCGGAGREGQRFWGEMAPGAGAWAGAVGERERSWMQQHTLRTSVRTPLSGPCLRLRPLPLPLP